MMRAKMRIDSVEKYDTNENLTMSAVCKAEGYPEDGSDENNTFAKFTPSAGLTICIANPELFGKFVVGQEFYVDFTPAN